MLEFALYILGIRLLINKLYREDEKVKFENQNIVYICGGYGRAYNKL
jgi:hypothetical protein